MLPAVCRALEMRSPHALCNTKVGSCIAALMIANIRIEEIVDTLLQKLVDLEDLRSFSLITLISRNR